MGSFPVKASHACAPLWAAPLLLLAGALHLGCGSRTAAASANPVTATWAITATAGANGTLSPSGTVTVTAGADQTFTVTPASGYVIKDLAVDGVSVGALATYTFSKVQAAHTLAATFAASDGLVWSDEFTGSAIDTTRWAFDLGNGPTDPGPLYGWGNGEMEYYTSSSDNVAVEDGCLVLTARKQAWGGLPFTSARVNTRGKFSFNQGRIVARIKMPEGNRMWPAFWLLGDQVESWPLCGEIDIAEMFCGTAGRGDNVVFATAHWWDETLSTHKSDSAIHTASAKLSADFHVYQLDWDATHLRGSIDGTEYWTMDITGAAMAELRSHAYYMVLNLAVGSPDFGMTSASQADGTLPQKMYVDYVRVYSNAASTLTAEKASQPAGPLGILADGTTCATTLDLATDAGLYLWNNLTQVTGTPLAGTTSLAVKTGDTSWFGFGYAATKRRNLLNYAAGTLNFSVRTTARDTFKIGIKGGNDGEAWVTFPYASDPYGMARDGQWHRISIPMTKFSNADFTDISQFFMAACSETVTAGTTWEFDEISWSENAAANLAAPAGKVFGIYTERTCDAGSFTAGTDGDINTWNAANGTAAAATAFEGTSALAFTAPAAVWYGLGIAPAKLYDLSAFKGGHMHIALKVPATVTADFKLGLKSPGGTAVRESWIKFIKGSDPYGMVRDGAYHELLIPLADFCNSDLAAVSQLLMLAGDGPAVITFDDVYLTVD